MSMNITPPQPHFVVNAAAPTTEALFRENKVKEIVPAPKQTEAAVPQKSREQDERSPEEAVANTYDSIKKDNKIINEDEQRQDSDSEQNDDSRADSDTEDANSDIDARNADEKTEQTKQDQQEKQEREVIQELKARDTEVRNHERAHAAVGGQYAGAPNYEYQTGPDGKKYAVGGEVSIDVSKSADPQATISKMQTVRAAALAPAEPSNQDRKVAAQASRYISEAKAEMVQEQAEAAFESIDKKDNESRLAIKEEQSEQDQSVTENVSVSASKKTLEDSAATTAQVVKNKYLSSFQIEEANFSAVA